MGTVDGKCRIPLNDGWWIEDDKAWFLTCAESELYEINLKTKEYVYLDRIPIENIVWRMNPTCFKHEDDVYCLPDTGEYIWKYSLTNTTWTSVPVENHEKARLGITYLKNEGAFAYLFSQGKKAILKFDLKKENISEVLYLNTSKSGSLGRLYYQDDDLYMPSSSESNVYRFSIHSKNRDVFSIPVEDAKFNLSCKKGDEIWISGFEKKIYIWNDKTDILEKVSLPEDFGEYEFDINNLDGKNDVLNTGCESFNYPAFINAIVINERIWYIPMCTNELIFIDVNEKKPHVFEIDYEEETIRSISNRIIPSKFILQYIKDNRFIGLYSVKNEWVVEIDTETMEHCILGLRPDNETINHIKSSSYSLLSFESRNMDIKWFVDEVIWPKFKLKSEYKR